MHAAGGIDESTVIHYKTVELGILPATVLGMVYRGGHIQA